MTTDTTVATTLRSRRTPNGHDPMHLEPGGKAHTMEVRDVHKSFGSFDVLQGLNLNFQDDAITTVLGPSGTGKSVLIKRLVGLLEPDQGEVSVFGKDIWKIPEYERY